MSDLFAGAHSASQSGALALYLRSLPKHRWRDSMSSLGETLLHYACQGDNPDAAALLLAHGLDVNAATTSLWTPAMTAAYHQQPRVLEVLCAAGAELVPKGRFEFVLDKTLPGLETTTVRATHCVRVLLANGARLATVTARGCSYIRPWMRALERGRPRCRAAVVGFLALKRPRRLALMRALDRGVVLMIGVAIWATRADIVWGREIGVQ